MAGEVSTFAKPYVARARAEPLQTWVTLLRFTSVDMASPLNLRVTEKLVRSSRSVFFEFPELPGRRRNRIPGFHSDGRYVHLVTSEPRHLRQRSTVN